MYCDECNQDQCICAETYLSRMEDEVTEKQKIFLNEVRKNLHPDFRVDSFGRLEFIGEMTSRRY